MANGRNKLRRGDAGRDAGGFVALPWAVLDSPAYSRLSHPAKALLLEFARQFVRDNNGRLLCSMAYLSVLIFGGTWLADTFRRRPRLSASATGGVGALFIGFGAKLADGGLG